MIVIKVKKKCKIPVNTSNDTFASCVAGQTVELNDTVEPLLKKYIPSYIEIIQRKRD